MHRVSRMKSAPLGEIWARPSNLYFYADVDNILVLFMNTITFKINMKRRRNHFQMQKNNDEDVELEARNWKHGYASEGVKAPQLQSS